MKNIFKFKKKFGQNFLVSESIAQYIVNILDINNKNVIEVGPGNFALTKYLIKKKTKKFIAIDIDNELIHNINNKNDFVMNKDALKFDELNYFNNEPFVIISNLPFNISSKLLIKWLNLQNQKNCIQEMVLMFQKEVGERIVSNENSKKYGRLTILAQSMFNVKNRIIVKNINFKPQPKVDAMVINFKPLKQKYKINFKKLEKITRFFFNSRRKKNEKKIKKLFSIDIIKKNKFDKLYNLRPEDISKETFYKMATLI